MRWNRGEDNMPTNQPTWELIANLGDVNPIEYGGYFVYRDTTGVYPEEAELLSSPDSDGGTWTVHRFSVDRLERVDINGRTLLVPFGFPKRTDLPHPIDQYEEWFSEDLERVASYIGQPLEELRGDLCSEDACKRAFAYRAIGEYHGLDNLDSYPLAFADRSEVESRYSTKTR
jgi:hypothetical protein